MGVAGLNPSYSCFEPDSQMARVGDPGVAGLCRQCDFHMHREAGASSERYERIEAELADTATQQIVEARLSHTETPCSLGLGQIPPLHGLADHDHQALGASCFPLSSGCL